MRHHKMHQSPAGFTIVELMTVIMVIAILAAIAIVGYGDWRTHTAQNEVISDLKSLQSSLKNSSNFSGNYPSNATTASSALGFKPSQSVVITGNTSTDGASYCFRGASKVRPAVVYYLSQTSSDPETNSCNFPG